MSLLKSNRFNSVAMFFFAACAVVAGYIIISSHAAPAPPTIYLNPSSQVVGPNGTITVQVRENSGTTAVNAAQANFSYPTSLVSFQSLDTSGSAFSIQAQLLPYTIGTIAQSGTAITGTNTGFAPYLTGQTITYSDGTTATVTYVDSTHLTSSVSKTVAAGSTYVIGKNTGTVSLGVGNTTAITGDQLIATLTFKAGSTSGSANMAFTSGTSLIDASTNQDILGGLGNTGGGSYTVDATPPTVTVTAPTNGSTVSLGSTTSITATSTDSQSAVNNVQFYIDGALVSTDTTSPYSYSWNTTGVTLGSHTIQAKSTDAVGNVGSSSTITVTVADTTAPTVSLTAPTTGTVVDDSAVTVSATAADNVGVASVQFQLDGANLGAADTTSPYSINWDTTTATNGNHTLTAIAKDAANNSTTSTGITVNVDNAAPTASITAPANGASVSGNYTVTATATDNTGGSGVAKVEFYLDGTLASTANNSPYSFTWNTQSGSIGSHTLTAKAYDKAPTPNVGTSSAVNVTVTDSTAPSTPTSLHTTATTASTVTLAWTASTDNVGVTGYKVSRNGTLLQTISGSTLTYGDNGLGSNTTYTYTVVAVDAAGNNSSAATLSVTTLTAVTGDINQDGTVNIFDLSLLLSSYGRSQSACVTAAQYTCDLNSDGVVGITDLSMLLSHFGQ